MKEYYICDVCKKLLKIDKDTVYHLIGSKGELYLCDKCFKEYKASKSA